MPQCIGQALRRLVLQLTSYTAAPVFPVPRAPSQLIILHRTQIRHGQRAPRLSLAEDTGRLFLGRRLYSSVVERQTCNLNVLGSIPSGGFVFVRFFFFTSATISGRSSRALECIARRSRDVAWPCQHGERREGASFAEPLPVQFLPFLN